MMERLNGKPLITPFPTQLVAASDSGANARASADYVCDGTADEVQINAAIAAVPNVGGQILLSEGTFTVAAPITSDRDRVILSGTGWNTIIQPATGVDPTALIIIGSTVNVDANVVRDLQLYGRTDVEAHAAGDGLRFRSNSGTVENVFVRRVADDGIVISSVSGTIWQALLIDCVVDKPGVDCFSTGLGMADYELIRCIAQGGSQEGTPFGRHGFYIGGRGAKLSLCHAYYNQNSGVQCDTDGFLRPQIIGGDYETNDYGIRIRNQPSGAIVTGIKANSNTSRDIAVDSPGAASAYVSIIGNTLESAATENIDIYNSDNCVVIGNICRNATTYSVRMRNGSENCVCIGNHVDASINNGDVSNIVRDNKGYVTENSGTSTINNGATSVVVAHGLAVTPTVDDISVVLAENPTNDPGNVWVDTIGAANFTVNCRNDPGVSNLDFGWRVQVL